MLFKPESLHLSYSAGPMTRSGSSQGAKQVVGFILYWGFDMMRHRHLHHHMHVPQRIASFRQCDATPLWGTLAWQIPQSPNPPIPHLVETECRVEYRTSPWLPSVPLTIHDNVICTLHHLNRRRSLRARTSEPITAYIQHGIIPNPT